MKKHRAGLNNNFYALTENMTDEQREAVLDCLIKNAETIIFSRAVVA